MKRYFYILFVGALLSLTSCVMDETMDPIAPTPGTDGGFQFIAIAEDFDKHNVGTRADDDKVSDSHISEMTMLIFRNDGKLLPAVDADQNPLPSSHINIKKPNPTFLINANKYDGTGILASMEDGISLMYYDNKANGIDSCRIYIVANAYHLIGDRLEAGDIKSIDELHAALVDTDASLSMPYDDNGQPIGLPMIGTHGDETFDLTYGGKGKNAIATIPLKKLYSKICFRIQVNSNQIVANGPTPKFMINRAEVYNVPSKIRMGYAPGDYVENVVADPMYLYTTTPCEIKEFKNDKTTISHSSSATTNDVIEFEFYMPEHMVTPLSITYPWDEDNNKEFENYRQYFKPTGLSGSVGGQQTTKIAPYVRICGTYYDHNAQIKDVSYDIYLGQNEYDDFEIKRNQQLNNHIVITGLTNHKYAYGGGDGNNVSIDHRVTVINKGYYIHMEREAILDAHFEVRPIDVELQAGSSMTITIPEAYRGWIAMESDEVARANNGTGKYVSNIENEAVRKYFTTNLVKELNNLENYTDGNGGTIRIPNKDTAPETKTYRVWFYVDENPNVYDNTGTGKLTSESGDYTVSKTLYRNAPVTFKFSGIENADPNKKVDAGESTINFQQWNLWRVWAKDANGNPVRFYDIEHEEEYLNNYVSDANYGTFPDGMPWGLDGVQLSDGVLAYWLEKVSHQSGGDSFLGYVINWIVSGLDNLLNIANSSKSIFSKSGKEPYYDFYLSRDKFPTNKLDNSAVASDYARDYKGIEFNREIAATLRANYATQQVAHTKTQGDLAQIEKLNLTQTPSSAFAYCYHKNKRNDKGEVVNQKWFLPAIDEIEEIALGAYDEFDKVFQNKKYWSCQPAYELNKIIIEPASDNVDYYKWNTMEGDFFNDNTKRARATSVYTNGTVYSNIESGLPNNWSSGKLTSRVNVKVDIGWTGVKVTQNGDPITEWLPSNADYSDPIFANPNGEYRGNTPRSESCRIRAVYRSGTK